MWALCFLAVNLSAQRGPEERREWFYGQRGYPGGHAPAGARLNALWETERKLPPAAGWATADNGSEWTFKGPQPTGPGLVATSGRVTALAVDPRNPHTVYLGAAAGGVWKTTNGGVHWTPLTDTQPSLATGSIALDPSNPDIVYVGTGEANACNPCYFGAGVLKSTDGGNSWRQLAGPFIDPLGRGARIASLAVHPANGNIVLAAVYFVGAVGLPGIYRSTNGGGSWIPVLNINQGTAVLFDPGNPNVVYAALYGTGVYKSTDGGLMWKPMNGVGANVLPMGNAGRVEMTLAVSSPETVYVGIADADPAGQDGLLGLFKTVDGGENWIQLRNAPDYCRPRCSYAHVLGVDPTNADVLYAGGGSLHRSLDGGDTWTVVSRGSGAVSLHADQHALAFVAGSPLLYVGNDGGVYSTANRTALPLAWSNLNSTLAITQFYPGLSIHPANIDVAFGGTQGNGTQRYTGNLQWENVTCRDGGWTVLDSTQPSTVYASCQGTEIQRSTNGGNSWLPAMNGIDRSDRVQLVPPLVGDPSNPMRLYFGTFRVYHSPDGAGSWAPISPDLAGENFRLTTIAVAPSDPNVVYVGTSNGRVHITINATAGARAFWANRSTGLSGRFITQIAVDPGNSFIAYAANPGFFGPGEIRGHVFKTTNLGESWEDVSSNLPNVPVSDVVVDPDIPDTLYAATDVGVFQTTDGGRNWSPLGSGLPRVVVLGLKLHRPTRTLRAATHGRGVWDLPVPLPAGWNPAPGLLSLSPAEVQPERPSLTLTVNGVAFVPGAVVHWNGMERPTTFVGSTQLTATLPASDLAVPVLGRVTVVNPVPGGGESNVLNLPVTSEPAVNAGGTVNGASFSDRPVAVGSIASTFGHNLAFSPAVAGSLPLPFSLGGAVLRLAGRAVPLIFVSPQQINFQVPWELAGLDSAIVQVSVGGVAGTTQSVRLAEYSPAIFTLSQSGSGQGAVLIGNTSEVAAPVGSLPGARPALRGEVISIFCTGLGPVSNPPASGAPAPADPLSVALTLPTVTFGNTLASVVFAGLAPGFVGLYQVNVEVPADAPTGDSVPLAITMGGVQSSTVTIAVQ